MQLDFNFSKYIIKKYKIGQNNLLNIYVSDSYINELGEIFLVSMETNFTIHIIKANSTNDSKYICRLKPCEIKKITISTEIFFNSFLTMAYSFILSYLIFMFLNIGFIYIFFAMFFLLFIRFFIINPKKEIKIYTVYNYTFKYIYKDNKKYQKEFKEFKNHIKKFDLKNI